MGKRSNFERKERDYYPTPYSAVEPLLPHLKAGTRFCEPCAGDGRLIDHLVKNGHRCTFACDLEPLREDIVPMNAMDVVRSDVDCYITNPPWPASASSRGEPTVSMAMSLGLTAPVWMLLSADFAHNVYFKKVPCQKIVSVGRVSWEGNGVKGKDNCAWYLFNPYHIGVIEFYGRKS